MYYIENPVSEKNPVNQESQELMSTVGGTSISKLIKMNARKVMKDSKSALLYELLNLIFNRGN